MKKTLSVVIVLATIAIQHPIASAASTTVPRIAQSQKTPYLLTKADQASVDREVARIETGISKKGESYRKQVIQRFRKLASGQPKSGRAYAMNSAKADALEKKVSPEASAKARIQTLAESLAKQGASGLKDLSASDVRAIAASGLSEGGMTKPVAFIRDRLAQETISACVSGTYASNFTLTCDYEKAVDYLKYMLFTSETIADYSLRTEEREYARKSVVSIEKVLGVAISQEPSETLFYFGNYFGGKEFKKFEMFMAGDIYPGGKVTFSAHDDVLPQ